MFACADIFRADFWNDFEPYSLFYSLKSKKMRQTITRSIVQVELRKLAWMHVQTNPFFSKLK